MKWIGDQLRSHTISGARAINSTSAPRSFISTADSNALWPPPTTATRLPAKRGKVVVVSGVRHERG